MEGNLVTKVLQIDGMTCTSCEMRIEKALRKTEGVISAKAIYSSSNVYVTYDYSKIDLESIISIIEKQDYRVKNKDTKGLAAKADVQRNKQDDKLSIGNLIGITIILLSLYIIISNTIGFNFLPQIDQSMGYGILFVVGLITSLHCVAMCGGINLSQCVGYNKGEASDGFSKLKPSLLYNTGRVISYTIIGGIVGALGSVVSFSGAAKGAVTILSGVFMVIMGLNMLNIFPWLRKINPRMPRFFGNKIHSGKGERSPFYVGLLNGLMPCGPLQAMQIYALGTGSFVGGAGAMFFFSLGTVPLMFGFGALSSILSGKFTHKMMKVSAVLVMFLGIIMLNRGLSLSGISVGNVAYASSATGSVAKIENNVQVVTTKLESGRYAPFIVQKGVLVKWTIKATSKDLNGCNETIIIPKYNITKKLIPGDNVIEFTPTDEGNITYTCWMGMIRSNIKVVPDLANISGNDIEQNNSLGSAGGAGGLGSCCGGGGFQQ